MALQLNGWGGKQLRIIFCLHVQAHWARGFIVYPVLKAFWVFQISFELLPVSVLSNKYLQDLSTFLFSFYLNFCPGLCSYIQPINFISFIHSLHSNTTDRFPHSPQSLKFFASVTAHTHTHTHTPVVIRTPKKSLWHLKAPVVCWKLIHGGLELNYSFIRKDL